MSTHHNVPAGVRTRRAGERTPRLAAAFALATAALAFAGCRAEKAATVVKTDPPPVTAAVAKVAAEPFLATVPVTGTLVSNARVDVKAETIGRITRFDKEEGDRVAAGEPVIWVNDENYQLALRQAETTLKVTDASLERASLLQSHSSSELERAENLLKSGGITDRDLKAAQLADKDAAAQVTVAAAQSDQARATLDLAKKHIRDTVIQSPVAGVIQRKFVNKGAYVEAPTAVFTVVDNGRLELEAPVASADLAPIQAGQRVTFSVNSYPGDAFEGRVLEVAPAVEAETRSAKVRIQVSNAAGKLKAGMFAQGEILTGSTAQAIVIPSSAVYRDDRSAKSSFVFLVVDGKAVKRNVRIGRERDSKLEIQDGLKPGDALITEQSIEIAEGVRIQARS
ncbi:MAG: efflux RND transporter periplasmic adaptor subunit [Acidobacteriia bacterium]|nr:efflux RND transporter periplasmic adaptor subunit [Terriglobia bacterium]